MNKFSNNKKQFLPYVLLLIVVVCVFGFYSVGNKKVNKLTYDEFVSQMSDGKVKEMVVTRHANDGIYVITGKLDGYDKNESFKTNALLSDPVVERILTDRDNNEFKLTVGTDPANGVLELVITTVIPLVVLGGGCIFLFTKLSGSNKSSMDFGRSRAKLAEDGGKVRFKDVAGLEEEKQEVAELIDFLKNPKKFTKMGARIPKGVLLVGPPGTGKTLLAKAVAGEANVPFYYISGSDFVELFVGVGASRVRDMFKQAKHSAPCLIFIDEIDAVGRQRGTGLGGGHDEREQTLNQLLTEMDGFGANEGIIVIAATNRPDVLDPALLRPGRFDRQVTVSLPDQRERLSILKVHAKDKTFAETVSLDALSHRTPGFSGADLENLLNEAALLAVRKNKSEIIMSDVDEAHDRVLMGPAKTTRQPSENDKKITAYHEAGHVVAGLKQENSNIVQKVTIIPRGMAGGYTNIQNEEEKFHVTKKELLETITTLLAGRGSEELMFKDITTGASNDIERATKIARAMVTEYGMSDLGPIQLEQNESSVFLGRDYNKSRNSSDQVAYEIDQEIRKIIDSCYEKTKKILVENKELLDLVAENLMKYETLTQEQIEYLVEHKKMPQDEFDLEELRKEAKEKGIKGYTKMTKEELTSKLNK